MSKCEDYPCCGCGPEGCIDYDRTVVCEDCGRKFHPSGDNERFCLRCLAAFESKMEEDDCFIPDEDY